MRKKVKKLKITHVVAVMLESSEREDLFKSYTLLTVRVKDDEEAGLLHFLPDVCKFIEEARREGKCLVVSFSGVSRGPAVAIAYMMKNEQISYNQAVKQFDAIRKSYISPNFVGQLELWKKMEFTIDWTNQEFSKYIQDHPEASPDTKDKPQSAQMKAINRLSLRRRKRESTRDSRRDSKRNSAASIGELVGRSSRGSTRGPSAGAPMIFDTYDELPPDIKKYITSAKIDETIAAENFDYLMYVYRFKTKRRVFSPAMFEVYTKEKEEKKKKSTEQKSEKEETEFIDFTATAALPDMEFANSSNIPLRFLKCEADLVSDEKPPYRNIQPVAKGGYGSVYSAISTVDKNMYAIKKMNHSTSNKRGNLYEVALLAFVDHPCIVKFIKAYRVDEQIWAVMEYMEGGPLTAACNDHQFTEKQVAFISKQIIRAVAYLHRNQLCHRDLKSHNIMLSVSGTVKLIDFGLCADFSEVSEVRETVGTSHWIPPEMLRRLPHSYPADIWSLAISILEMANQGYNKDNSFKVMFMTAVQGNPNPFTSPQKWSPVFHSFMEACLHIDPTKRATAEELKEHEFIKNSKLKSADMKKLICSIFLTKTADLFNI